MSFSNAIERPEPALAERSRAEALLEALGLGEGWRPPLVYMERLGESLPCSPVVIPSNPSSVRFTAPSTPLYDSDRRRPSSPPPRYSVSSPLPRLSAFSPQPRRFSTSSQQPRLSATTPTSRLSTSAPQAIQPLKFLNRGRIPPPSTSPTRAAAAQMAPAATYMSRVAATAALRAARNTSLQKRRSVPAVAISLAPLAALHGSIVPHSNSSSAWPAAPPLDILARPSPSAPPSEGQAMLKTKRTAGPTKRPKSVLSCAQPGDDPNSARGKGTPSTRQRAYGNPSPRDSLKGVLTSDNLTPRSPMVGAITSTDASPRTASTRRIVSANTSAYASLRAPPSGALESASHTENGDTPETSAAPRLTELPAHASPSIAAGQHKLETAAREAADAPRGAWDTASILHGHAACTPVKKGAKVSKRPFTSAAGSAFGRAMTPQARVLRRVHELQRSATPPALGVLRQASELLLSTLGDRPHDEKLHEGLVGVANLFKYGEPQRWEQWPFRQPEARPAATRSLRKGSAGT
jgi:hypothetical protein